LGIPGAQTWQDQWADHLNDIPTIYLLVEPDPAGESLLTRLSRSPIRPRLRAVRLDQAKDPSDLYLADPNAFQTNWEAAMKAAVLFEGIAVQERSDAASQAWEQCAVLAKEPRILDRLVRDLHRLGAVGEERAAKLIFLALVSRLLDRPVSL